MYPTGIRGLCSVFVRGLLYTGAEGEVEVEGLGTPRPDPRGLRAQLAC